MLHNSCPLLLCIGPSLQVGQNSRVLPEDTALQSCCPERSPSSEQGRSWLPWKGLKKSSILRWKVITCSPVGTCYPDLKSSAILPKSWKAFTHYLRDCSTVRKKCHLGNLLAGCSPGLFWTIFYLPLPDLLSFNFKNWLSSEGSLLFGPPFLCSNLQMAH